MAAVSFAVSRVVLGSMTARIQFQWLAYLFLSGPKQINVSFRVRV